MKNLFDMGGFGFGMFPGAVGYSNPVIRAPLTIPAASAASVVFCGESSVDPANCLTATVDTDAGTCGLTKTVAGVETALISVAITYADAAELILVVDKAEDGLSSSVSMFYDGEPIGTTQTITEAAILRGKKHYLSGDYGSSVLHKRRFALGADIPRNFVAGLGSPVIDGDTITLSDEIAYAKDEDYWGSGKIYAVDASVSEYTGSGNIVLPYDGSGITGATMVASAGQYKYEYMPGNGLVGIYSYPGHAATVTVNSIQEVLLL